MLRSQAIVSFLWFLAIISISSAEVFETPDEIAEIPLGAKTAFARHVMEISDLLHMFIALIKKADEAEGRELGLPEITTTVPIDLETASLEELFDRFETAAQSFRTRFLKYLKTTETPFSSVTPTIPTVFELNKGEDLTKYIYKHENVDAVGSVPNSEIENEYSASTVDPDASDSDLSDEKTTLAFILSNSETLDSKMESEYSASSAVPDFELDSEYSASSAVPDFELDSEYSSSSAVSDFELDSEYSASSAVPDKTLAFILSNEEEQRQETDESSHSIDETFDKDFTLTLVPIAEENLESFIDETSFESFLDKNFETSTKLFVTEATFDSEEEASLNEKPVFTQASDQFLNGAATLIFASTTEDEEIEIKTEATSTGDSTEKVTVTPLTTRDDSSEDSTFIPVTATDYDSDEKTMDIRSTMEDSSDEEIMATGNYDESEKETTSTFTNKDESSIEEMTELVKILREAAEKYDTEESAKKSKLEEMIASGIGDFESLHDSEHFVNSNHMSKVPAPIEYVMTSIPSENWEKVVDDPVSLKTSSFEGHHEDTKNGENISGRIGLMQTPPVYSHLDYVIGAPGEDYPNYTNIAATSFTCEGKESPGLYADLETRCQVFHACWPLRRESYLCPVGSTFNQRILSCDYWFNSTCSLSQDYYDVNHRLQNYRAKVDGLYEYFDESDIYPYNSQSDHSHPIFNEMKFLPFLYKIINYSTKRGIESGTEIDYNKTVEIEFDKDSTLPTFEDLTQDTTTDLSDSVKDRFRELLRSFVASEVSKNEKSSDEDSSLGKMKLQERKYVHEKMFRPKFDRSGIVPDAIIKDGLDEETTSPKSDKNHEVLYKSTQSKTGKEQIAPAIVFKVLETAENVVNKGILPMTRDMLAASYVKLYKRKKL